jgi:hypothetical protein
MSSQNRSVHSSTPPPQVDFTVECYHSVFFVRGETGFAKAALHHLVVPDAQWLGDALGVEGRFVGGLASALHEDGWRVRLTCPQ